MINKIIQFIKKTEFKIFIIFIIFIAGIGYSVYCFVNSEIQKLDEIKLISEPLKLKVEKEKILYSQIVDNDGEKNLSDKKEDKDLDKIVKYFYISDTEVPIASYQGLEEDITKRTNNAQFFKKGETEEEEEWVARFYSGAPFYKDGDKWHQVESATTTEQAFSQQIRYSFAKKIKNLFKKEAIAASYYAGGGDGYITANNTDWSTLHSLGAGIVAWPLATWTVTLSKESTAYFIYRSFLPFDTSSLDDAAIVTQATLSVHAWVIVNGNNDGDDWINVVQTFQADSTTLSVDDFDTCGDAITNPTEGSARKDLTTDFTLSQYNDFVLNTTALSWINPTGYTNLGLREGHDVLNQAIENETENSLQIVSSEGAGTDADPYLSVTYVLPSTFKLKGTIKMNGTVKF